MAGARVFSLQDVIAGRVELPVVADRLRVNDDDDDWSDDSGTESQSDGGEEDRVVLHHVQVDGDLIEVFDRLGQTMLAELHTDDSTYLFENNPPSYVRRAGLLKQTSESIGDRDVYDCLADLVRAEQCCKVGSLRRILVIEAPFDAPDFLTDGTDVVLACQPGVDLSEIPPKQDVPFWVLGQQAANGNLEIRLAYIALNTPLKCCVVCPSNQYLAPLEHLMDGTPDKIVRAMPFPIVGKSKAHTRPGARHFMRSVVLRNKTLLVATSDSGAFAFWCAPAPQQVWKFREVKDASIEIYRKSCRQLAGRITVEETVVADEGQSVKRLSSESSSEKHCCKCKCRCACRARPERRGKTGSLHSRRGSTPKLASKKWSLAFVPEKKPKPKLSLKNSPFKSTAPFARRRLGTSTLGYRRVQGRPPTYIELMGSPELEQGARLSTSLPLRLATSRYQSIEKRGVRVGAVTRLLSASWPQATRYMEIFELATPEMISYSESSDEEFDDRESEAKEAGEKHDDVRPPSTSPLPTAPPSSASPLPSARPPIPCPRSPRQDWSKAFDVPTCITRNGEIGRGNTSEKPSDASRPKSPKRVRLAIRRRKTSANTTKEINMEQSTERAHSD